MLLNAYHVCVVFCLRKFISLGVEAKNSPRSLPVSRFTIWNIFIHEVYFDLKYCTNNSIVMPYYYGIYSLDSKKYDILGKFVSLLERRILNLFTGLPPTLKIYWISRFFLNQNRIVQDLNT